MVHSQESFPQNWGMLVAKHYRVYISWDKIKWSIPFSSYASVGKLTGEKDRKKMK